MSATLKQKKDGQGATRAEKIAPEEESSSSSSTLPPALRPDALDPRSDVAYLPGFVSVQEEEALLRHLKPSASGSFSASSPPPPPPSAPLAPGWRLVAGRRLRVLGGSVQNGALTAAPLPSWMGPLVERLRLTGAYAERRERTREEGKSGEETPSTSTSNAAPPPPNHALVNCYSPGEGIMPHEDGPLYHPAAAIVSLGSWAVLRFYSKRSDDNDDDDDDDDEEEEEEEEEEGKEGKEGKGEREVDEGEEKEEENQKPSPRCNSNKNVFSVALAPRSLVVFTGEAYKNLLHGIEAVTEEELDESVLNREDEQLRNASKEDASVSGDGSDSLRVIPRGGGGGEGTEQQDLISLTVRRVLRERKNLLAQLGPRV